MLFDHDAEGKRGLRTFCGFASRPAARRVSARRKEAAVLGCRGGPGIRNLRAEMTALSTLAAAAPSETSLVRQEHEDVAFAGALAVAVADGMSGYAARRGDNAHRDAVLQRPRRAGLASAAPVCSRFEVVSCARSPMTTRSEYSPGPPTCLRWCSPGTWTAGQIVDMDLQAGGRYLLFNGGLGQLVDDRPHLNVFISPLFPPSCRAAGRPGRRPASVSRLTPYHWARVLQAGQAGSRLPLPAEDARPQISRDTGYRGTPGGTSAAAFVPDAPGRIGVPSP
jgi:hypothetical protein